MKVIINETGEELELHCIDPRTGTDCADDIIGNSGAIGDTIVYDPISTLYRISQEDYAWWAEYLADSERDERRACELAEQYGDAVWAMIDEETYNPQDYDSHHDARLRAFARIAGELERRLDA